MMVDRLKLTEIVEIYVSSLVDKRKKQVKKKQQDENYLGGVQEQ